MDRTNINQALNKMIITRTAFVIIFTMILSGCTQAGNTYRREMQRWSRHAEVFDFNSLRAELMWDAVLLTPSMRVARVEREAQLRHVNLKEAKRYIPDAWDSEGTVFYVNFFAPADSKDLLASDTYWRIELHDAAGNVYEPTAIKQVPITPIDRKLFQFLNHWSKAYILQFPVASGALELKAYGLNATSHLVWEDGNELAPLKKLKNRYNESTRTRMPVSN